jgi:hypothetical protein
MISTTTIAAALRAADTASTTHGKIAAFLAALPSKFIVLDANNDERLYAVDLAPLIAAVQREGMPYLGGSTPRGPGGSTPSGPSGGTPSAGAPRIAMPPLTLDAEPMRRAA